MTEEKNEKKKTMLEFLNETFQWLVFGSILFKKGSASQTAPGGQADVEIPRIPAWIVSMFHFLTTEDEQEYDQLVDDTDEDPGTQSIFFSFKNNLVADGYDEDHMRLMLVNLNRDWLNRKDAKKTNIPNSAKIFIEQIILLDPDYTAQKDLAKEKKFLKKVTLGKKIFIWVKSNKGKILLALTLAPFLLASLIYQILNLLLG